MPKEEEAAGDSGIGWVSGGPVARRSLTERTQNCLYLHSKLTHRDKPPSSLFLFREVASRRSPHWGSAGCPWGYVGQITSNPRGRWGRLYSRLRYSKGELIVKLEAADSPPSWLRARLLALGSLNKERLGGGGVPHYCLLRCLYAFIRKSEPTCLFLPSSQCR